MSFASSSTATTEVVSNRLVLASFGSLAGVGRRCAAAVDGWASASQMANQAACATNAAPIPAGEDQIHGVTGNKKDGKTKGLSAPP